MVSIQERVIVARVRYIKKGPVVLRARRVIFVDLSHSMILQTYATFVFFIFLFQPDNFVKIIIMYIPTLFHRF